MRARLDIAGVADLDGESAFAAKGPTGTPLRAFVAGARRPALTDQVLRDVEQL